MRSWIFALVVLNALSLPLLQSASAEPASETTASYLALRIGSRFPEDDLYCTTLLEVGGRFSRLVSDRAEVLVGVDYGQGKGDTGSEYCGLGEVKDSRLKALVIQGGARIKLTESQKPALCLGLVVMGVRTSEEACRPYSNGESIEISDWNPAAGMIVALEWRGHARVRGLGIEASLIAQHVGSEDCGSCAMADLSGSSIHGYIMFGL